MKVNNNIKYSFILFIIVSIIDIIGIVTHQITLRNFAKPLILITLMTYYFLSVKTTNKLYLVGLLFSFLGDVFLLNNGELYFILGLTSFLLAHILYIKITIGFINNKSIKNTVISVLPFVLFFIILILVLKPHLGKLIIPVIIYGIVISVFGMVATLNYLTQKKTANLWLFLGALFFIISDSILAFNKFYYAKEIYGIVIMGTYIIAQFMICKSLIIHSKNNTKVVFNKQLIATPKK